MNPQQTVEDEWLTSPELASWLKIPVDTLYAWRYRRYGPPAHRVGKHLRYRRADVEAWLAEQRDDSDDKPVRRGLRAAS